MKLLLLLVVAVCCLGASPPVFGAQFTTTFNGTSPDGPYEGVWAYDYVNKKDKQWTQAFFAQTNHTVVYLDRYDLEQEEGQVQAYTMCYWLNECTKEILVPPMNRFAVPKDASFTGQKVVNGEKCDMWVYKWKDWVTTYAVGTVNGELFPRQITYSGNQPHVVVDWNVVKPGQPEPSIFDEYQQWDRDPGCVFRTDIGGWDTCPPVSLRVGWPKISQ